MKIQDAIRQIAGQNPIVKPINLQRDDDYTPPAATQPVAPVVVLPPALQTPPATTTNAPVVNLPPSPIVRTVKQVVAQPTQPTLPPIFSEQPQPINTGGIKQPNRVLEPVIKSEDAPTPQVDAPAKKAANLAQRNPITTILLAVLVVIVLVRIFK